MFLFLFCSHLWTSRAQLCSLSSIIPPDQPLVPDAPPPRSEYEQELHRALNEDQLKCVVAPLDSRLVVVSGPGSGKTRILSHRVAYLVKELQIPEERILCITFTVKAATEMQTRVAQLLDKEISSCMFGTFHSVCAKLLRQYGVHHGLVGADFSVLDQSGSEEYVKKAIDELGIDFKDSDGPRENAEFSPLNIVRCISAHKEKEGFDTIEIESTPSMKQSWKGRLQQVFNEYQRRLREANVLDFADLLQYGLRMMRTAELCNRIASRFQVTHSFLKVFQF